MKPIQIDFIARHVPHADHLVVSSVACGAAIRASNIQRFDALAFASSTVAAMAPDGVSRVALAHSDDSNLAVLTSR